MEIIRIQAAGGHTPEFKTRLLEMVDHVRKGAECKGLYKTTLCRHGTLPGYFAIALFRDTEKPETEGSLTGLELTRSIETFGQADHSVWIEETNNE